MNKKQKKVMHHLQIELVKLQREIIASNLKVLIILEGRDAAGKDGTIKRIIEHLSPRETRVVALSKPSNREENEWYFQRYAAYLPSGGELVIFNRSWYNRAGVEKVMHFCTNKQYEAFFANVELFEKMLINSGLIILKYYLDISKEEQQKRLLDRKKNPLKQWKISPIDEQAQKKWKDYSKARNEMLSRTNYKYAPWFIANAENKDNVHIDIITHIISQLSYPLKDKKMTDVKCDLIYEASNTNIKRKLYR